MVTKRKRKPMSEEQRLAAVERLAKAREAKGHNGSKSVNPLLLEMDEDSPIHWKKVREWVKEITVELRSKKNLRDSKLSKERQEYRTLEVYLANLKRYLESSIWLDKYYGRNREGKMVTVVSTMAYHPNGNPKRTVGNIYPDIGEYTQEMKTNDDRIYDTDQEYQRKRKLHEQEEVFDDGGEDSDDFWNDIHG